MSALNQHQARHVLATFTHVDGLLQEIEQLARDDLSPFAAARADFAPDEARLTQSFVSLARARMLAALDRLGIARPAPSTSARWSVSTALTFCDIALSELDEANLKGYGAVDPAAAGELLALAADLRDVVARGKALLHEHEPGGLAQRVAAVPGSAGEVLQAVERLSAERGFAQLRPLIAAAVERASAATFDVGIFGRVSAGKSSLINALIGTAVLPVGATPVTAVPVRIAHGDAATTVQRMDGSSLAIDLADIPAFATEAQNPQNAKGVRAIEVSVPSVPPGLRLLDTPGVGSLASSGPAQAFAWLPRCDLGLVLIAAGSAVARDDLALVVGLDRAGIECRVLVSKADVLSAADVDRSIAYVRGELASVLGADHAVDVRPVSTVAGHDDALRALRSDVLAPLAAHHAEAAARALRSRLHRLLGATAAAMSGRDGTAQPQLGAHKARAAARDVVRRETDRLAGHAHQVLEDAATAVAHAWAGGEDAPAAARGVILDAGARALAAVRQAIDDARRQVNGDAASDRRRIPPLFDPDFLDALAPLAPPALGRQVLGRRIALGRLEPIAGRLDEALSRYAGRLYAWGNGQLDEVVEADAAPVDAAGDAYSAELARLDALLDAPHGAP